MLFLFSVSLEEEVKLIDKCIFVHHLILFFVLICHVLEFFSDDDVKHGRAVLKNESDESARARVIK